MKALFVYGLLAFSLITRYCYANNIAIDKLLVPDFAKAQIVSDKMNFNGMNMAIIQFYTIKSIADVVDFYRKEVGNIKVSKFEQWTIVSWLNNKKLNTVQITRDELQRKTHGFIALSNLPALLKTKPALGKGFPSLNHSSIINDIKATDLNKKSRTIWLSNKASVRDNISFYKSYYLARGWQIQQVSFDKTNTNGAMLIAKQGNEVNLSAVHDKKTRLTNLVAVVVTQ